jgi:integrase
MSAPTISFWKKALNGESFWICQVRLRKAGQSVITVQARHKLKTTAYANALKSFDRKSNSNGAILDPLIKDLVEAYLEAFQGTIKGTTLGEYAYVLRKYLIPPLGHLRASEVSPSHLRSVFKDLLARDLSAYSVNTVRARVHALFSFATQEGVLEKNPVQAIRPQRLEGSRSRVQEPWNVHEVRKALEVAEGTRINLFLYLAIYNGLRRGEIVALTWEDFDPNSGTLLIDKSAVSAKTWFRGEVVATTSIQSPKTSSSRRVVYCSPKVLDAISSARAEFVQRVGRIPSSSDPIIFKDDGMPFVPSSISQSFHRFCSNNDLRRIRVHDLRHTAAVLALEAGVPLEGVSEGLGHAGVEVTKRIYARHVPGLSRRFTDVLGDYVDSSAPSSIGRLEASNA